MAETILGTLTIGQAPRPDVTPILDRYVPTSVRRIHRGLLDGLASDAIADAYAAKAGEAVLVTRLAAGSSMHSRQTAATSCCCCAPVHSRGFVSDAAFCSSPTGSSRRRSPALRMIASL